MSSSSAKTPTARKGFRKPVHITGYLAGAVGTAALLSAPQAEAAVTAVTFGFGAEYTSADGGNPFWTVGPGFGTLLGYEAASGNYLTLGGSGAFGSVYHDTAHGHSDYGRANFFANGTVIGANGNGNLGEAQFFNGNDPVLSFTSDQLNKNIGFKTSNNNWGWANVSWTESTKSLAINSAFVESVANTPITINAAAIPEPSRALLALAGLGGVALRRRRKQAA